MKQKTVTTLFVSAACVAVTASAWAQINAETNAESDVNRLQALLYSDASRQDQRDIAAARLLARPDLSARTFLAGALADVGRPGVQLAVVRALSDAPTADTQFITPLMALMDASSGKPVIDAAATALTAYKTDPAVLPRLLQLARDGNDERVRVAAIRAAGTFIDLRAAGVLIDLLDPTAQPPSITTAAGDALAYMSGLDGSITDTTGWRTWWEQNQNKPEQQFRAEITQARAQRFDAATLRLGRLQDEVQRMLAEQYQRLPQEQRVDVLLRFLKSSEPTVRAAGAKISADAAAADVTPVAIKEQLRQLIGDADSNVRRNVASALALVNDADAVPLLLTQLAQEPDSGVRSAIAMALRPTQDVRAVPLLLPLLEDPASGTAQAAAQALAEPALGDKLRQNSPALADEVADRARLALTARTTAVNNTDLRNDLVQVIGAMRSKPQAAALTRLLAGPSETPRVRRSLLQAVSDLRDPQLADAVVEWAGNDDSTVRMAAVRALGQLTNSFEFERILFQRLDPAVESEQDVRDTAWRVVTDLLPKATNDQLENVGSRLRDQPARRLIVLTELRKRYRAQPEEYARRGQQIGQIHLDLGQPEEALVPLKEALEFATETQRPDMVETISESMTEAFLRARQYQTAIDFVEKQIKVNRAMEGTLPTKIKNEAERLVNVQDYAGARQLIGLALGMNPRLKDNLRDILQQLDQEVVRRTREQNQLPGNDTSTQNALAWQR
jgi:HEAT repeat protein